MCSNFGLNLHPGRKPAAQQWQWYYFALRMKAKLRKMFPRFMERMDADGTGRTREEYEAEYQLQYEKFTRTRKTRT
jgi:hypothetical protein